VSAKILGSDSVRPQLRATTSFRSEKTRGRSEQNNSLRPEDPGIRAFVLWCILVNLRGLECVFTFWRQLFSDSP
jgi:hypothetical protein